MPRILIVDDEADVASSLDELLRTSLRDAQVETAGSFRQGFVKAEAGRWDAVMCDHRLPDGKGSDILACVARSQPAAVRVLMSAHSDFDMMLSAVNRAQIDFFLPKPWEPEEVIREMKDRLHITDRDKGEATVRRIAGMDSFRRLPR
ncbi:MAG: response regulator [Halobacteriales archaeon]|nr:response regulator [Halobacteriales archaeon]